MNNPINRNHIFLFFSFLFCAFVFMVPQNLLAQHSDRVALVVGNADYADIGDLHNARNDAIDMSNALKDLGFDVTSLIDADLISMENAVSQFTHRLTASPNTIGLFYYAGHAVQSNGINYLLPVDSRIPEESYLKHRALPVQVILDELQAVNNNLNIVILDACRDNPFSWARSGTRGLSVVSTQPPGSIVVYATSAGSVALEGTGRNGVFTGELLKHINTPRIDVMEVFNRTCSAVQQVTNGKQNPAIYSQFFDKAYLSGSEQVSTQKLYGSAIVKTNKSGTLYIDGVEIESLRAGGQLRLPNQEVGLYTYEMKYSDLFTESKTVEIEPDKELFISFSANPPEEMSFLPKSKPDQAVKIVPQLGHGSIVHSISFSPDGRTLASGSGDSTIKLWDVASGNNIRTLEGHTNSVWSVVFSPDGRTLASGSYDKTIKLWNVASGKKLRTLEGHSGEISSVVFSPDGRILASGSYDKTIKLWDVATGRVIRTLGGYTNSVLSVAFSPDGRTLASGSWDSTIKLWDVTSGKEIRTLEGHNKIVWSIAFSPDGRTLASGSGDNTIKLWGVTSGREIRTLKGHTYIVWSVAFSPDGRTLASGSGDNTIKLWDVASGREIRTLEGHTAAILSVAFSPDGRTLASGSYDGTIRLWDIQNGKELAMYISFKDGEWLVVTPLGYYNASANGEKYLNVVIGDQVTGIENYRDEYFKPDLTQFLKN